MRMYEEESIMETTFFPKKSDERIFNLERKVEKQSSEIRELKLIVDRLLKERDDGK